MEVKFDRPHLQSLIRGIVLNGHIDRLPDLIDRLIHEENESVLKEINLALANPDILSHLVKVVTCDLERFSKMLSESYYHENGFHKIVLLSGKYFKLRLHYFGDTERAPMENIHDHRWSFASSILSGELKMDLFSTSGSSKGAEELYHFEYNSDKTGGLYETKLMGKSFLLKSESRIYYPGETYVMNTHELHRIKNTCKEKSVTLILTGKPISQQCNIYSKRPILDAEKKTLPYESEALKKMLDSLIELVYPQKN